MAELAPCVAVIGPASSGKTTLLHLLDAELQDHPESPLAYVVKGNPDGSGRYLYYSRDLRNSQKGRWTDVTLDQVIEWVRNARRHLEIVLVDVGGSRDEKARPGNERLFKECDYYLALARTNVGPDDGMEKWIEDAKGANLKTFAELESHKERGDSSFDQVTKKGLFRGDDTPPNDPLNQSLSTKLTENLVQMRVRRTMPGYLDLRRRRRWRESELPSLGGRLVALQSAIADSGEILLGGVAPIFAYAAALHHAMDVREDARIRVFDPKVAGGEIVIPQLGAQEGQFPEELLRLDWGDGDVLVLKAAAATDDKFLPPNVLAALPRLKVPEPPRALAGRPVEINGSGPIWLHLALSLWTRQHGAEKIGHWDASLKRVVWAWTRSERTPSGG